MWENVCFVSAVILVIYVLKKLISSEPSKTKYYFYFLLFYLYGSFMACIVCPFFLFNPKNVKNAAVGAWLIKPITKVLNLKWNLRNGKVLSKNEGAVIISNHQSSLDILGLFNIWGAVGKLAPVAKKEIFYVWPFGLAAYLAGVVFIDRKNTKDAYEQLKITSEVMVKQKTKIWLFPEGTRNKENDKLLPFKKGAFAIAVAAQRPIIPVVFSPYYFIIEKKYIFNKGHIIVECLEPVSTEGLTMDDVPDLMERVWNQMNQKYKDLMKEVLSALPPDYIHAFKDHNIATG
ncbi:1-acyl-sn-glycerol-3-phosphate acyltransferase alpha-like [Melitaea cinxia]|uniref:1-acyl-sn-glycerol-3-phosphate acyltransferase alpha-like n=1 Tax=Melitaea cinxia TaxID=113334 RepID=UPI001E271433|nr:1-acyl-sn-glycerol-3-phosphate acyltransferase alpha-like [Melitaea cinxia]